jgi:hypothetical protein
MFETSEEMKRLGRCRSKLKDNIKMNINKNGCEVIDWIFMWFWIEPHSGVKEVYRPH